MKGLNSVQHYESTSYTIEPRTKSLCQSQGQRLRCFDYSRRATINLGLDWST